MRYDELPEKQKMKADIIHAAIKSNSTKQARLRASVQLNVCDKTIRKYIKACSEGRYEIFIHGNMGHKPSTAIPEETRKRIVEIYTSKYSMANYRHFREILEEDYGICVSAGTLFGILTSDSLLCSPKATRKTVRNVCRKIRDLESCESISKEDMGIYNRSQYIVDRYDGNPRKSRSRYMGELIQMDASQFKWNGKDVWQLHIAIDDATGEVVGAYFDNQETLSGYYNVLGQILMNYGIPIRFHTDKRSCFIVSKQFHTSYAGRSNKKNFRSVSEAMESEESTFTQFRMTLQIIGSELIASSEPLFKPRAERLNGAFQGRLPAELVRNGLHAIDAANAFLPSFIRSYNSKFSLKESSDEESNVFVKGVKEEDLDLLLSIRISRVIQNSAVRFEGRYYAIYGSDGRRAYFEKNTPSMLLITLSEKKILRVNAIFYGLREIPKRQSCSVYVDSDERCNELEEPAEKPYVPKESTLRDLLAAIEMPKEAKGGDSE